jgi:copper chaperone CopZ
MLPKPKIYSIKVSGIKCTNCAGKIKNALDQLLDQQFTKVTVNIMQ